jgi:hypothetical protein
MSKNAHRTAQERSLCNRSWYSAQVWRDGSGVGRDHLLYHPALSTPHRADRSSPRSSRLSAYSTGPHDVVTGMHSSGVFTLEHDAQVSRRGCTVASRAQYPTRSVAYVKELGKVTRYLPCLSILHQLLALISNESARLIDAIACELLVRRRREVCRHCDWLRWRWRLSNVKNRVCFTKCVYVNLF